MCEQLKYFDKNTFKFFLFFFFKDNLFQREREIESMGL